jgi:Fe2+ transport system protein FeoA
MMQINVNAIKSFTSIMTYPSYLMNEKVQKNLSLLKPGEEGFIEDVLSTHRELKFRVLSLGLVKGTQVKVLNVAPLGDPITIEVRGSQLSLRKDEASIIKISDFTS